MSIDSTLSEGPWPDKSFEFVDDPEGADDGAGESEFDGGAKKMERVAGPA